MDMEPNYIAANPRAKIMEKNVRNDSRYDVIHEIQHDNRLNISIDIRV